MKRWLVVALAALVGAGLSRGVEAQLNPKFTGTLTDFIEDIRFDESMGTKKPTPRIPKSWKFVSATKGFKENSNNLYFQDAAGNVYLVVVFESGGDIIAKSDTLRLNVDPKK